MPTKEQRQKIFDKYKGHCAYCGKEISLKEMQADHIHAKYLNGSNELENFNPSCRACNFRKGTMDIETFRIELMKQRDRLIKNFAVRQSLDYGLIEFVYKPIKFYFEEYEEKN